MFQSVLLPGKNKFSQLSSLDFKGSKSWHSYQTVSAAINLSFGKYLLSTLVAPFLFDP